MPTGGEQGGPLWNVSRNSDPLLQLKAAFDAVRATAQDCVHVLPRRSAVMPSPQELAAALAMPAGGVPGGLNVNVSGDSEPLLQLSAAPNALYVHKTA